MYIFTENNYLYAIITYMLICIYILSKKLYDFNKKYNEKISNMYNKQEINEKINSMYNKIEIDTKLSYIHNKQEVDENELITKLYTIMQNIKLINERIDMENSYFTEKNNTIDETVKSLIDKYEYVSNNVNIYKNDINTIYNKIDYISNNININRINNNED